MVQKYFHMHLLYSHLLSKNFQREVLAELKMVGAASPLSKAGQLVQQWQGSLCVHLTSPFGPFTKPALFRTNRGGLVNDLGPSRASRNDCTSISLQTRSCRLSPIKVPDGRKKPQPAGLSNWFSGSLQWICVVFFLCIKLNMYQINNLYCLSTHCFIFSLHISWNVSKIRKACCIIVTYDMMHFTLL